MASSGPVRPVAAVAVQLFRRRDGGFPHRRELGCGGLPCAVTVTKLVELADFYGIPVSDLLPDAWIYAPPPAATAIVLDLQRLRELPTEHGALLARYVSAIEHQRGDYNGQVLSIRGEDLRSLAILYDRSPHELLDQFIDWEVLATGTRPTTPH